jgi:hypothetical protein
MLFYWLMLIKQMLSLFVCVTALSSLTPPNNFVSYKPLHASEHAQDTAQLVTTLGPALFLWIEAAE